MSQGDQTELLRTAIDMAAARRDPGLFASVLGDLAKARGMSGVARAAGVTREGLYRALSKSGEPQLSTLLGVIDALGLKISVSERDV